MVTPTLAQQYVYPAKGQSAQQQKNDEAACYEWAVKQSGFDPAKPPPPQPVATAPTTANGTTPGAGARGAARRGFGSGAQEPAVQIPGSPRRSP
jgi:hypothetical protein